MSPFRGRDHHLCFPGMRDGTRRFARVELVATTECRLYGDWRWLGFVVGFAAMAGAIVGAAIGELGGVFAHPQGKVAAQAGQTE